jgi:hypothetical protein
MIGNDTTMGRTPNGDARNRAARRFSGVVENAD